MSRYGWRLMRGKTKSPISLVFFLKNSLSSCDCPIKLHSHLLAAYPRSAGGLEGILRPGVRGVMPRNSENRSTSSTQIFLAALPVSASFTRCQKGAATPTPSEFSHDCPFFLACVPDLLCSDIVTISPWAITCFSILRRGTHSKKSQRKRASQL